MVWHTVEAVPVFALESLTNSELKHNVLTLKESSKVMYRTVWGTHVNYGHLVAVDNAACGLEAYIHSNCCYYLLLVASLDSRCVSRPTY